MKNSYGEPKCIIFFSSPELTRIIVHSENGVPSVQGAFLSRTVFPLSWYSRLYQVLCQPFLDAWHGVAIYNTADAGVETSEKNHLKI